MEMSIFGFKFRPVVVLLCMIIGASIGCFALCSCSRIPLNDVVREGFKEIGAPLIYNMGKDVDGSYENKQLKPRTLNLESNRAGTLPLPPGEMLFFADNDFKPECCSPAFSGASTADGCACVTKEQVDYINMRGGNRTSAELF